MGVPSEEHSFDERVQVRSFLRGIKDLCVAVGNLICTNDICTLVGLGYQRFVFRRICCILDSLNCI